MLRFVVECTGRTYWPPSCKEQTGKHARASGRNSRESRQQHKESTKPLREFMSAPKQVPDPTPAIENVLSHLRQAEADLMALVRTDSHPDNSLLFEVHAFLWEAISTLSRARTAAASTPSDGV